MERLENQVIEMSIYYVSSAMLKAFHFILQSNLYKKFYIEIQLIHNVVLIATVQKSDSAIHLYIYL